MIASANMIATARCALAWATVLLIAGCSSPATPHGQVTTVPSAQIPSLLVPPDTCALVHLFQTSLPKRAALKQIVPMPDEKAGSCAAETSPGPDHSAITVRATDWGFALVTLGRNQAGESVNDSIAQGYSAVKAGDLACISDLNEMGIGHLRVAKRNVLVDVIFQIHELSPAPATRLLTSFAEDIAAAIVA